MTLSLQGVTVTDSTQIFSIDFTVIGSAGQSSNVSFSNTPTTLEIVDNISIIPSITLINGYIFINNLTKIINNETLISLYPTIVKASMSMLI